MEKGTPQSCTGGKVCPGGASKCLACSSNSQCSDDDVCAAGSCKNPSGLTYVFTLGSGTVPEKDENGSGWDGFGGLPDVQACLYIDDKKIGCTSTSKDTTSPSWFESFETKVYASEKIIFRMYDVDFSSDDYMSGVQYKNSAAILHAGGDSGAWPDAGFKFTWTVKPK